MRNTTFNRLTTIGCWAAILLITLAANIAGQGDRNGNVKTSILPLSVATTGETVPYSGTSLSRNNHGVFFTAHTQGLTSGHVVTAWMAVFNNPQHCATNPCTPADFANPLVDGTPLNNGGQIIGLDGAATYGAFRAIGDATGARPGIGTGNGVVDPRRAEIHIVIRSHGPAMLGNPTVLAEQLSMFNGGCPPNTCVNIQMSVHQR